MNRRYKRIILAVVGLLLITATTIFVIKCSSDEEEIFVPTYTYYITVEKDIKTNFDTGYSKTFNDMNDVHVEAAMSYGVEPESLDLAIDTISGALQKVNSCSYYEVDKLTHSHPYLVPHAKDRLDELGKAFTNTLAKRGGGSYRFIITSILRQEKDIKRLQRGNVNSTENSAHLYGTTVDISYRRFDKYNPQFIISDSDLKELLAEVLNNFKNEGKCYVKYEVKQGCFHITFR